jgi:hypothetical protein
MKQENGYKNERDEAVKVSNELNYFPMKKI